MSLLEVSQMLSLREGRVKEFERLRKKEDLKIVRIDTRNKLPLRMKIQLMKNYGFLVKETRRNN